MFGCSHFTFALLQYPSLQTWHFAFNQLSIVNSPMTHFTFGRFAYIQFVIAILQNQFHTMAKSQKVLVNWPSVNRSKAKRPVGKLASAKWSKRNCQDETAMAKFPRPMILIHSRSNISALEERFLLENCKYIQALLQRDDLTQLRIHSSSTVDDLNMIAELLVNIVLLELQLPELSSLLTNVCCLCVEFIRIL